MPILQASQEDYGMFEHFKRFPWVLDAHRCTGVDDLLADLSERVIAPSEAKARALTPRASPSRPDGRR